MIERRLERWCRAMSGGRDGCTLVSERASSTASRSPTVSAMRSRHVPIARRATWPGRPGLLSLGALRLSSDCDPSPPTANRFPQSRSPCRHWSIGALRDPPMQFARTAPRIAAASPVERAALGYLHANCGMCHTGCARWRRSASSFSTAYACDRRSAPALGTSLAQASYFQAGRVPILHDRIAPGIPDASMLLARIDSRHPVLQMPPLGSRIVDAEGVALLRRWIVERTSPLRSPARRPTGGRHEVPRHHAHRPFSAPACCGWRSAHRARRHPSAQVAPAASAGASRVAHGEYLVRPAAATIAHRPGRSATTVRSLTCCAG